MNRCGIKIPSNVRNTLEDAFRENPNIDSVECYHLEDVDQFEKDLTLVNDVVINTDGKTSGVINNVWTYWGNVKYFLTEKIIVENNTDREVISDIDGDKSILDNPDDFAIVIHEKVHWDNSDGNKDISRNVVMNIFCPYYYESSNDEYEYEEEYKAIVGGDYE